MITIFLDSQTSPSKGEEINLHMKLGHHSNQCVYRARKDWVVDSGATRHTCTKQISLYLLHSYAGRRRTDLS